MFRIVEKRKWYFVLSGLIIIPGLIAMIYLLSTTGLPVTPAELRQVFVDNGLSDPSVTTIGNNGSALQVRLKPIEDAEKTRLSQAITTKFGAFQELQYSQVGPAIGREVTQ